MLGVIIAAARWIVSKFALPPPLLFELGTPIKTRDRLFDLSGLNIVR